MIHSSNKNEISSDVIEILRMIYDLIKSFLFKILGKLLNEYVRVNGQRINMDFASKRRLSDSTCLNDDIEQ